MLQYYRDAAAARPHLKLDVCVLPRSFDAAFTKSLNDKPGLLALAMDKVKRPDGSIDFQGIPFIVVRRVTLLSSSLTVPARCALQ